MPLGEEYSNSEIVNVTCNIKSNVIHLHRSLLICTMYMQHSGEACKITLKEIYITHISMQSYKYVII